MKRLLLIILAGALLLSFAACKKEPEPTTTAAPTTQATTAVGTTEPTTGATTETTTQKEADLSFLYSGYWYKNEGSKVLALQFEKDGSLTVNTYRRKSMSSAADAPDSVIYGSFKDKGDGTLYVYPDNEFLDEFYVYTADSEKKTLTCENDDPQASALTEIALTHFDSLSKENARKAMAAEN